MRRSRLGGRSMSAGLAAYSTPRGTRALPLSHPFPVPLLVPRRRRGVQWCVVCLVWDTALLGRPPSKAMDTPVQRCLFHPLSPSSLCTVSDGWMAHAPRQRQACALRQARPMLQVDDDASNGDLQGDGNPEHHRPHQVEVCRPLQPTFMVSSLSRICGVGVGRGVGWIDGWMDGWMA